MSTQAAARATAGATVGSAPLPPTRAEIAAEWHNGWKPGLAAFIAGSIGPSLWASLSSLFIGPMRAEFGWTQSQFAFAFNATIIVALLSPYMGRLVDRYGGRRVAMTSLTLLGLGYVGLGLMWGSLIAFYLLYMVTMIVGTPGGGLSFGRVISEIFVKSRGLAISLTRSGMAIAATGMPPLIYLVIANYGWRAGFAVLAAMLLLIAVPLCYFWIPRHGVATGKAGAAARPSTPILALARNPKVLILCVTTALGYAPCIALLQLFQPIMIDKQIDPMTAASLIGAMGAAGFVSGLVGGALVDRVWAPLVTCGAMAFGIVGCLVIMPQAISTQTALLGTLALGVAQGTQIQVSSYMIARYLGLTNFSTIFGLAVMAIAMLVPVYINLITHLHEALGTHASGLTLCIASFGVAMLSALAMGRYPRDHQQ